MEISSKEKNFISAVVYCYNDEGRIGRFVGELDEMLAKNFLKYEIIVVNDSSTDNSVQEVRDYASGREDLVVSLLNMSYHQGLEDSMNAGVNLSIGDFVFEFDAAYADFSWDLLMKVYFHSLTGYDVVSTRADQKQRLASHLFYMLFNKYAHLQYAIGTETFRILSRRAINRIHSLTQSIPFRKAAYANCGLAVDTLVYEPISEVVRKKRDDKCSVAIDSLILFTDVAYRLTVGLALLMFLLCICVVVYACAYWLMETPVEGWATTVIFNSLGFGGLFLILAMVIKYLQTLVQLVFKRKEFIFESIQKLQ